jgi:hypothetical protein
VSTEAAKMRIEFEVGAGGVDEGIQIANTSIDQFLDRLKNVGPGAGGADRNIGKLTDTLKDFKSEQTQNARLARFFAGELSSIVPGAEGAQAALSKVFAAFAGGFGAGFVLDAVVFGLGQVSEAMREDERQAQALRQIHRDTWRVAIDSLDEYQQGLSTTSGDVDKVWRGISKRVTDEVRKIQDEIDEYESSLSAKFRAAGGGILNFFFGSGGTFENPTGVIDTVGEKIDKLVAKQQAAKDALKDPAAQEAKRLAAANENSKKHADFLREEERLARASDDEIAKIRGDLNSTLETLRRKDFASDEDFSARRVTLTAEATEKVRRIREDREREANARRRTLEAQSGTEIEKLDADHENRLEELRERIRRTSIEAEQQRIRQQIADETAGYVAKRELFERERDARLLAAASDVDRKRYEQSLGFLKTQADLEDVARARHEAGGNEQLAQDILRIQQAHDRERADLEILHGENRVSEAQYQRSILDLDARTATERMRVFGQASAAGQFINPLVQNWQTGLEQMLSGTYNWSNLHRAIFASLVGSFAQGVSQMAATWLGEHALMFAGWAALKVKELGVHAATETGKTSTTIAGVAARVPAEAGEAAVLAGASAAALPGIGWMIALPAAGAVLGGLLAYGLASASGGYDIGGESPITQLHPREMVLPESIAEPLRQSIASGGTGVGGGAGHVHLHLPDVMDATGLDRVLTKHEGKFVRFLKELKANNRIS